VPTDAEIIRSARTLRRLAPQLRDAVKALRVLEASMGEEVFGKFNVGPDDAIDQQELIAFVEMAREECRGMALQIVVIAQ
jgi:hypothetical protein